MRPITLRLAALLAFAALFVVGAGSALADGGKSVAVKPLNPKAGDVITVKGAGLGANRVIEILLVGQGVSLDLGEVQSVEDGDFEGEFTLPADLKPGLYQLTAAGDGSESAQVTIGTPAGGSAAVPASVETAPIQPRPLGEAALLVAIFGALAGLGLFFAQTAGGLRRTSPGGAAR